MVDGLDYNDWEMDNNNFGSGYLSTDLNGDGIVDGLDFYCGKLTTISLPGYNNLDTVLPLFIRHNIF
ncbi:MAG: hypothetical protein HWD58_11775 [Bacteroidota bacterium]|nr:MAG: hypothetical protein HWD58_11775 [Bacteroidota bacterium]